MSQGLQPFLQEAFCLESVYYRLTVFQEGYKKLAKLREPEPPVLILDDEVPNIPDPGSTFDKSARMKELKTLIIITSILCPAFFIMFMIFVSERVGLGKLMGAVFLILTAFSASSLIILIRNYHRAKRRAEWDYAKSQMEYAAQVERIAKAKEWNKQKKEAFASNQESFDDKMQQYQEEFGKQLEFLEDIRQQLLQQKKTVYTPYALAEKFQNIFAITGMQNISLQHPEYSLEELADAYTNFFRQGIMFARVKDAREQEALAKTNQPGLIEVLDQAEQESNKLLLEVDLQKKLRTYCYQLLEELKK